MGRAPAALPASQTAQSQHFQLLFLQECLENSISQEFQCHLQPRLSSLPGTGAGIRWVTPGSHLVPAVSNGSFPCVFRDQVSKYPANLQRGMENVALRKKKAKKKEGKRKPEELRHFLLTGHDVLGSCRPCAHCLQGMALPAVLGSLESHFQEQQNASWPARAPAALGFTMEYFFTERSGGCKRPLCHHLLPPPAFPTESLEQDPAPTVDRAAHVAPV